MSSDIITDLHPSQETPPRENDPSTLAISEDSFKFGESKNGSTVSSKSNTDAAMQLDTVSATEDALENGRVNGGNGMKRDHSQITKEESPSIVKNESSSTEENLEKESQIPEAKLVAGAASSSSKDASPQKVPVAAPSAPAPRDILKIIETNPQFAYLEVDGDDKLEPKSWNIVLKGMLYTIGCYLRENSFNKPKDGGDEDEDQDQDLNLSKNLFWINMMKQPFYNPDLVDANKTPIDASKTTDKMSLKQHAYVRQQICEFFHVSDLYMSKPGGTKPYCGANLVIAKIPPNKNKPQPMIIQVGTVESPINTFGVSSGMDREQFSPDEKTNADKANIYPSVIDYLSSGRTLKETRTIDVNLSNDPDMLELSQILHYLSRYIWWQSMIISKQPEVIKKLSDIPSPAALRSAQHQLGYHATGAPLIKKDGQLGLRITADFRTPSTNKGGKVKPITCTTVVKEPNPEDPDRYIVMKDWDRRFVGEVGVDENGEVLEATEANLTKVPKSWKTIMYISPMKIQENGGKFRMTFWAPTIWALERNTQETYQPTYDTDHLPGARPM